jgi:hypothetical protein
MTIDKNLTNCARNRPPAPDTAERSRAKTVRKSTGAIIVDVAPADSQPRDLDRKRMNFAESCGVYDYEG